jgi:hypothetical protein
MRVSRNKSIPHAVRNDLLTGIVSITATSVCTAGLLTTAIPSDSVVFWANSLLRVRNKTENQTKVKIFQGVFHFRCL